MDNGKISDTLGAYDMNIRDPWYTVSGAAAFLGVEKSRMKKLHAKGVIYGEKHGKVLLFHIDDLNSLKYGKITRKV